jgi:PEP-CTERM motif
MRKSLWIIPLLFAAIVAPNAHADTYSISFLNLDSSSSNLTAPDIQWNGGNLPDIYVTIAGDSQTPSFTLISTGFSPPSLAAEHFGQFELLGSTGFVFRLYDFLPLNNDEIVSQSAPLDPLQISLIRGEYLVNFTDTPEPSTAVLLLAGIGLLGLVMQKRMSLPRTTLTHR